MSEEKRQPKRKKRRSLLGRLMAKKAFRIAVVCVCVILIVTSIAAIMSSLFLMRESPAIMSSPAAPPEPLPTRTAETEAVSAPEPTPAPTPVPTPVPTPEPTEGPYGWKKYGDVQVYIRPDGSIASGLRNIDGKLHYFDFNGKHASQLGIDVSFYNKGINWPAVKNAGVDFAIVRLGYRGWETGILHRDSCFLQNLRGAKAAGIKVGVYFFSTAANAAEGAEEAAFVLESLNGFPLDMPVFLDVEESGDYPNGRADKLSNTRRYEIIESFRRTIENGGYRAGVYSYQNFVKYNKLDHCIVEPLTFWFASYTRYNRLPEFDWPYDLWQFTDHGAVGGIRGLVDMNAVFK